MSEVKKCAKCKFVMMLDFFPLSKQTKDGRFSYCKECHIEYQQERYSQVDYKVRAKQAEQNKPSRKVATFLRDRYFSKAQVAMLKSRYGLTPTDMLAMVSDQDNRCKICFQRPPKPVEGKRQKQFLCVDHDHDSGKIRGLLCDSCNIGLGGFKDNTELFQAAINYLKAQEPEDEHPYCW